MAGIVYPAHRAVDIPLRDGASVRLRPVRPADRDALLAFLTGLGVDGVWFRDFAATADLEEAATLAATVDYADRYGIVALDHDGLTVSGFGCYLCDTPGSARIAFLTGPHLRAEGVATTMLAHLAQAAREAGIERFTAEVPPDNHGMIAVFRMSGLDTVVRSGAGMLHVSMPTTLTDDARRLYDEREAEAAAAAVANVLQPASVAVFGASDRPDSVGGAIFGNLLTGGFRGPLHGINARGGVAHGQPLVRSLDELPHAPELAVIAVPAPAVPAVARACGERGVRALVVVSAGFREAGEDGVRRERELLGICRAAGMRLVGPNCLGVMNTAPDVQLNATFVPGHAHPGNVGFISQSGALGIAVVEALRELGLGLSSFVSIGNKADLSGNDILSYWERDPATDVALLYVESFGNPRKFARVARRVGRRMPIIAVKGGRSAAGLRAAGSHTGALLAQSDVATRALFQQAGVILTDTMGELFDVAALLSAQPAPAGDRVAVITNGGGLGILCADACAAAGIPVQPLPDEVRDELQRVAPGAAVANPVDLLAAATPQQFGDAMRVIAASGAVDALIVLYVPPLVTDPEAVAHAIRAAAGELAIPVATVFTMSDPPRTTLTEGPGTRLPLYRFPEEAARAIARAARHGAWLQRPDSGTPRLDVDDDAVSAVIARALHRGPGWLAPDESTAILTHYGIPQPEQRLVADAAAAGQAAEDLGGEVAVKAVAPGLVHRTDSGAVHTGLCGRAAVEAAAAAMDARVSAHGLEVSGFLVQRMAAPGTEFLAGVVDDATFGPVVACSAGGTLTELLGDTAVRLTPLSELDAHEMVRSLRTFPLLDGYRGADPADVAALERVLVRFAALADRHHEVAEVEANPVIVSAGGAVAVDVRIRVRPAPAERPEPSLRAP